MNSLLPLLLLAVPTIGAIVCALLPRGSRDAARNWALLVSLVTLAIGVAIAAKFDYRQQLDPSSPGALASSVQMHFGKPVPGDDSRFSLQIGDIGFAFHLGIDTISLWLVL